jgi:3-methyl-2-oxobutanoate hydroxymethyltransferase
MSEAGCDCVKVEVDAALTDVVTALARAGIPVMAHLGLRPQSVHRHGGYHGQGRDAEAALIVIEDARRMEDAGASALLLEAVPDEVAAVITERTALPVIGCVAGPHCDGTVVVLHDMLGYSAGHPPRSVKRYANLHETLIRAFSAYAEDVRTARYPRAGGGVAMAPEEWSSLQRVLAAMRPAAFDESGESGGQPRSS